jgi:predicted ester cyclase
MVIVLIASWVDDSCRRPATWALTRDELVARLIRAGELEVSGGDQTEIDSYFDTSKFRFHGPNGFEADYAGLANYFKSIRAAFDDRSIRRGIIVAEANYIACQTWMEGRFVREFAPAGAIPPNGQRVLWDLINIFRFDDQGRLVEEWVPTDYRSFLGQLGAQGRSYGTETLSVSRWRMYALPNRSVSRASNPDNLVEGLCSVEVICNGRPSQAWRTPRCNKRRHYSRYPASR